MADIIFRNSKMETVEFPEGGKIEWRISVYAVVRNAKKEILLVVSPEKPWFELPGGATKIAESALKAAVRETHEETGYRIKLISSQPFYVEDGYFYHEWLKKYYHSVNLVFQAELLSGKQEKSVINKFVPNEIARVEWVALADLTEKNVFPPAWPVIEKLKMQNK